MSAGTGLNNHIVPWWPHEMGTFSALLALCEGNHRSPVDSPCKGPVTRALVFSLILAQTNGRTNNWSAGDLRHLGAHCDITVMGCIDDGRINPIWNYRIGCLLVLFLWHNIERCFCKETEPPKTKYLTDFLIFRDISMDGTRYVVLVRHMKHHSHSLVSMVVANILEPLGTKASTAITMTCMDRSLQSRRVSTASLMVAMLLRTKHVRQQICMDNRVYTGNT